MASSPLALRVGGPRLRLPGGDREVSAFRACGLFGLACATAVALSVSAARDLSLLTELALIATSIAVFAALALATRAVTGREALVYYHHEIAVLAVAAAVAWALGGPVLPYLDATALGLGSFLACGRVGCLLAGCCHGLPSGSGVVYGQEHAAAGFPGYLVGCRLVPVQALEAAAVAGLVIASALAVGTVPGAAFGTYVMGYAVLRFGLEQLRGDPVRRYWHGLSEPQWTSLAVATGMAALAVADVLPGAPEHLAAVAGLALWAPFVARRRPHGILDPQHVRELARVMPVPRPGPPAVHATSAGLRLSAGRVDGVSHYTMTRSGTGLSPEEAQQLARLIAWLTQARRPERIVAGAPGTYHLVIES
jgi:prolipoprotein diacylglyceryl transferase